MMSTYTCMLISESTAVSSSFFFFFNDTATTEIYTLSLHDALPISVAAAVEIQRALRAQTWPADVPIRVRMAIHTGEAGADYRGDRKSTRLNSSHLVISYAVFCLKKKKNINTMDMLFISVRSYLRAI